MSGHLRGFARNGVSNSLPSHHNSYSRPDMDLEYSFGIADENAIMGWAMWDAGGTYIAERLTRYSIHPPQ